MVLVQDRGNDGVEGGLRSGRLARRERQQDERRGYAHSFSVISR
jgi:hypothetical protein